MAAEQFLKVLERGSFLSVIHFDLVSNISCGFVFPKWQSRILSTFPFFGNAVRQRHTSTSDLYFYGSVVFSFALVGNQP